MKILNIDFTVLYVRKQAIYEMENEMERAKQTQIQNRQDMDQNSEQSHDKHFKTQESNKLEEDAKTQIINKTNTNISKHVVTNQEIISATPKEIGKENANNSECFRDSNVS